jgi:hypothetical protein
VKGENAMSGVSLRRILTPLVGAAICLAAIRHAGAVQRSAILEQFVEQFVARAASASGAEDAGRIDIYIQRWSTDKELDSLRGTLTESAPSKLLPVLQNLQRRAGVILMPGVQGLGARSRTRTPRNLLFAREVVTRTGRRVIAASDEHLGLGESRRDARRSIEEFNLMDIRFGPDGTGVGKLATATDVAYSPVTKILEVKNYATQPVRLIDVRSEKP